MNWECITQKLLVLSLYNLVKYLADKEVVGVGLDTWGVDTFADEDEYEYGPEHDHIFNIIIASKRIKPSAA